MRLSRRFPSGLLVTVGLLATVACGKQPAATSASKFPNLSGQQARELINKNRGNPGFMVLDVRTRAEFAGGHLPGAVNVDFRAADFEARAAQLARSKSYLVYCRTGHRSGLALPILQRLGFTSLYHLEGGIAEWQREGLPVEPGPAPKYRLPPSLR
jgi:rhodanese-related sulfurtransferase